MMCFNRWKTVIAACAVLPFLASPVLAAGGKSLGADSGVVPATLQDVPGSDLKQVTLTARAVERIALLTEKVEMKMGRKVVPYSSIIYDPNGGVWVYSMLKDRVFLRSAIDVDDIVGDDVFLNAGPSVGTRVATDGVAEISWAIRKEPLLLDGFGET